MSIAWDPGVIVEAVIDVLAAGMPTELNTLDAAYADGITLDDINKWYRARLGQYDVYPCQVVIPVGEADIFDQDGGFGLWKHRLEVVTLLVATAENPTVGGDSLLAIEGMQVRLGRYMRATAEVLNAGRSLTVTGASSAKIVAIGPPNWFDFEYDTGNPAAMRRSFSLPLEVVIK